MQARSRAAQLGVAALALAASVQLACGRSDRQAQNGTGGPGAGGASARQDTPVNLTGCMERGVIPGSFVLTHVSTAGNVADRMDGATGTSGSAGNQSAAVEGTTSATDAYTVMSGQGDDLGTFVGKRVTVSGRFATAGDRSGRGTATSGTGASGTVVSPGDTAGPDAAPGTPGVPGSRASAPGATGSGASAATADSTAATRGPSAVPTRLLTASDVREVGGSCTPGSR